MDIVRYVDYVNSNMINIAKYVDTCFESSKELIKAKVIRRISDYIKILPTHYVKVSDNNPHDCSGILEEDGLIDVNQSIIDFLDNEYSGNVEATYISRMGWLYRTYGDELSYYTIELASDIMFLAIRKCIETEFSVNLSDNEFEQIGESCGDFDEIYDNCVASDFFFYHCVIKFVGIENIKLATLQRNGV